MMKTGRESDKETRSEFLHSLLADMTDTDSLAIALSAVIQERQRQEITWGIDNHPDPIWFAVLSEEVGELASAILRKNIEEPHNLREELVQVAAVSIAWLQQIEEQS